MLEKVKSYFIILLILSLSFVPSVNAASDIFDEPVHVDYETYKQRMIEYIETPDYLKANMPPIIGKNEYVDFSDIILADDELCNILPNMSNQTINNVKDSPLFRSMNYILIKEYKDIIESRVISHEEIPGYLDPFNDFAHLDEISTFTNYVRIADEIKNILIDNKYLVDNHMDNPFLSKDTPVKIDGLTYTIAELQDRISSSYVGVDGYYHFTMLEPVASQIMPVPPGVDTYAPIPIPPNYVRVKDVADFINDNCYIIHGNDYNINTVNNVLTDAGKPNVPVPVPPGSGDPPFRTGDTFHQDLLVSKTNANTALIDSQSCTNDLLTEIELIERNTGHDADINPASVRDAARELGVSNNYDGDIVLTEKIPKSLLESGVGCIETGIFFVFAIISLILAFVYR
jgi:hypothetical protein